MAKLVDTPWQHPEEILLFMLIGLLAAVLGATISYHYRTNVRPRVKGEAS